MPKTPALVALLVTACVEYTPQSNLPPAAVPYVRPLEAQTQTDKVLQVLIPEVDVLWVIDNSCSMANEQAGLAQNFSAFMQYFIDSGLDYHIGVTSTDMDVLGGSLRTSAGQKWIDDTTGDPIGVFGAMAVMGTGGSGAEKGRDPAYAALEVKSQVGQFNEGFVRDLSSVHVVVISDEEDESVRPRDEFIDWMNALRYDDEMVTFSSITTPPLATYGAPCPGGVYEGAEYHAVTAGVGGFTFPICNPDWSGVLDQLGLEAAGLKREYFLSQLPVPETIRVWVIDGGVQFEFQPVVDWTYVPTRNSITFVEYVPDELAEVYVEYEVLGAHEE